MITFIPLFYCPKLWKRRALHVSSVFQLKHLLWQKKFFSPWQAGWEIVQGSVFFFFPSMSIHSECALRHARWHSRRARFAICNRLCGDRAARRQSPWQSRGRRTDGRNLLRHQPLFECPTSVCGVCVCGVCMCVWDYKKWTNSVTLWNWFR